MLGGTPGNALSLGWQRCAVDAPQGQSFSPVSITLESGEVVGVAGAEGNGHQQLFDTLAGRTPPRAGRVECEGKELTFISPAG